uniref:RNA exonuclease 4 n=1 Tax=Pogona vitticeps TaxID=103695 RepID=A0A6J0TPU8_9SAUR
MKSKKKDAPAVHAKVNSENLPNQHRKEKKKIFWKKKLKHLAENSEKNSKGPVALPPKNPQEVSSNWKALQELLKQKAASLNPALTAPETYSKKKHTAQEGRAAPNTPKINGRGRTVTPKPVKEGTSSEALKGPGVTESDKNLGGKNQRKAKELKRDQGQSRAERKQEDIKHKRRKTEEREDPKPVDIWFDDVDPDDIEAALGPEAAKVARKKLGIPEESPKQLAERALVKEKAFEGLTKTVAMDCEMVGVGPTGEDSVVARVSIVNLFGKCVYDKFVKPTEKVSDYRTRVSGIRPENLRKGEDFKVVQKEVADILKGRILVGHALHNDLKILFLDHPKKKIRDTQRYKPFKQQVKSGRPSLKLLCEKLLNVKVQTAEHNSIQDAQATMRLYTMAKKKWEASLKEKSQAKKPLKEIRQKKTQNCKGGAPAAVSSFRNSDSTQ